MRKSWDLAYAFPERDACVERMINRVTREWHWERAYETEKPMEMPFTAGRP